MRPNRKTLNLALTLTALFVVAAPATAQPGRQERDHCGALPAYRAALARVGLSDEQKAAIRAIAERTREQGRTLQVQQLADRAQLRVFLAGPSPDPVAVGNAVLAIENNREQLRSNRRAAHEATLAVLTHDQRIAFTSALDTLRAVARQRPRRLR